MLEPGGGLQPSQVKTGRTLQRRGQNLTDEEANPEQFIANAAPDNHGNYVLTEEQLEALAATDEISDVLERLSSYIAIQPDLGSSFAYIDFKQGFELPITKHEQTLAEVQRHWLIVQDLLFSRSSSLVLGIHSFVQDWLTYGKLYLGIIRDVKNGKPIDIHVQNVPFKEMKLSNATTYWTTDADQTIWEQEDIFSVDYTEINKYVRSYVASIMRTYNMWTTVERTRVANAVMAAQFRSIYTVPTSGLGKVKARQKLSSVMALYKRDIRIDNISGETTVNGKNSYPVNTELWVAETSNGKVSIDNPGDGNVQLNSTDLVEYFMRKYYKKGKLPMSKYEAVDSGYLNGLSDLDEDERQFKLYIQKCRAILGHLFIDITWRLQSALKEYVGREDIRKAICMDWYNEPEHKTDAELLDGIADSMDKVKEVLDKYKEVLESAGFNKQQQLARINVLRVKLMRKYCPDMLEQTQEDYRNVPTEESPEQDDSFSGDDFSSDFGTDDFSDWDDSQWDNEFSGGDDEGDDWSMPEYDEDNSFDNFEDW